MYMDIEGNELGVLTGHSDTIQDVAVVDNFVFTVSIPTIFISFCSQTSIIRVLNFGLKNRG